METLIDNLESTPKLSSEINEALTNSPIPGIEPGTRNLTQRVVEVVCVFTTQTEKRG